MEDKVLAILLVLLIIAFIAMEIDKYIQEHKEK